MYSYNRYSFNTNRTFSKNKVLLSKTILKRCWDKQYPLYINYYINTEYNFFVFWSEGQGNIFEIRHAKGNEFLPIPGSIDYVYCSINGDILLVTVSTMFLINYFKIEVEHLIRYTDKLANEKLTSENLLKG